MGFMSREKGCRCKLCHKYDTKNRQNQSKVWNKEACTTIRKEKLNMRHPLHTGKHFSIKEAIELELNRLEGAGILKKVD